MMLFVTLFGGVEGHTSRINVIKNRGKEKVELLLGKIRKKFPKKHRNQSKVVGKVKFKPFFEFYLSSPNVATRVNSKIVTRFGGIRTRDHG